MAYSLGIDLGTTFTAAATCIDGRTDIVSLGNHAATIPSMVFLRDDGDVIIGDVAQRRGQEQPDRLAREFKRRFGDATPIMLGHTPYSAERLMAAVLTQVSARVAERQGGPPDSVAIAHPANWGPYKIELLRQAAQLGGLGGARLVTEPEAAAVHFAMGERMDEGDVIAVYDLGGGTFDAAVLRRTGDGFETLAEPQGIERLGGIDFDEAVFSHVRSVVGDAISGLDGSDPTARAALNRLKEECAAAKEALSDDSETSIPVLLPGLQTQVRMTRAELEDAIRPALRETVDSLRRALDAANVTPEQLKAVVLAGGSSRIPLVRELVGELGRPVALDAHPKHTVALGAARLAAESATPTAPPPAPPAPAAAPAPVPAPVAVDPGLAAAPAAAVPTGPPPGESTPIAPPPPGGGSGRRGLGRLIAVGVLLVAILGVGGYLLFGPDGDGDQAASTTTATPTTSSLTVDTVSPDSSTTTSATATCTSSSGRCVFVTGITLEGDSYVVGYTTVGYEPLIAGAETDHHIHFYFDTVPTDQAGSPGSGPWVVWDLDPNGNKVFQGEEAFRQSEVPEGATQICALVATIDHRVDDDPQPSCVDLP